MSLYLYRCLSCNIEYDKAHSINDKPEYLCTGCGSKLKRVPTLCGFKIKGACGKNEWGEKPDVISGKEFNDSLSE